MEKTQGAQYRKVHVANPAVRVSLVHQVEDTNEARLESDERQNKVRLGRNVLR